ncbi:hypothetical protein [Nitrosospira sp. Nsp14]|uniref:hypothetical protein n=1 Tax=Nitrosospira sp. Nsp14 TaxID=1855333 RepID=UPI001160AEB9|nr:hypothetical protein [Nitrosospira sp. Nsp14]
MSTTDRDRAEAAHNQAIGHLRAVADIYVVTFGDSKDTLSRLATAKRAWSVWPKTFAASWRRRNILVDGLGW